MSWASLERPKMLLMIYMARSLSSERLCTSFLCCRLGFWAKKIVFASVSYRAQNLLKQREKQCEICVVFLRNVSEFEKLGYNGYYDFLSEILWKWLKVWYRAVRSRFYILLTFLSLFFFMASGFCFLDLWIYMFRLF